MGTTKQVGTRTPIRKPVAPKPKPEPLLGDNHPLNDVIGTMQGPNWEAVLRNIKRNRKELDNLLLKEEADS